MRERQFEALRVEGEGSGRRHARRRLLRFEIQLAQPLVFVRRARVLLLQFPDAAPLRRIDRAPRSRAGKSFQRVVHLLLPGDDETQQSIATAAGQGSHLVREVLPGGRASLEIGGEDELLRLREEAGEPLVEPIEMSRRVSLAQQAAALVTQGHADGGGA